jgi:ubiquinone/menaquinone biosynthesis C-methylase UbiE
MKVLIESNNLLAWLTGNLRDKTAMKDRIRKGYEGEYSRHVTHYDELAGEFQKKVATYQLYEGDFQGKQILDVGGGTGIMAILALEMGASKAICGDISSICLNRRNKQKAWDITQIVLNSVNWMLKYYHLRIIVSM